jgi:hypothetical protein
VICSCACVQCTRIRWWGGEGSKRERESEGGARVCCKLWWRLEDQCRSLTPAFCSIIHPFSIVVRTSATILAPVMYRVGLLAVLRSKFKKGGTLCLLLCLHVVSFLRRVRWCGGDGAVLSIATFRTHASIVSARVRTCAHGSCVAALITCSTDRQRRPSP